MPKAGEPFEQGKGWLSAFQWPRRRLFHLPLFFLFYAVPTNIPSSYVANNILYIYRFLPSLGSNIWQISFGFFYYPFGHCKYHTYIVHCFHMTLCGKISLLFFFYLRFYIFKIWDFFLRSLVSIHHFVLFFRSSMSHGPAGVVLRWFSF